MSSVDLRRDELRTRLLALMREPHDPAPSLSVDRLALDVLRYQAEANLTYGRLLQAQGLDPERLVHWWDFPPIPVRGFREGGKGPSKSPYIGDPAQAQATFLTSGTTGGADVRGIHRVRDLALYHTSLLSWARHGLAGADKGCRILALLPAPDTRPESSLVHMAGVLMAHWDDGGGGFFMDPAWHLDLDGLEHALVVATQEAVPVLVLATAFALVHWLDQRQDQPSHRLAQGSRLMETGGFKGRTREVPREQLYRATSHALGLPEHAIVNEYGMTEMLSQFYDTPQPGHESLGLDQRILQAPPWVRTRILDPVDLHPVPQGTPGLLAHLDLANLDSAAYLLTEDLGVDVDGYGFRVLGRTPGSLPRGCSLSMEAWLAAEET